MKRFELKMSVIFLLMLIVPAFSQLDTAWIRHYNSPEISFSHDTAVALAVDTYGNVYVTGTTHLIKDYFGLPVIGNYTTIKYNSNGDTLWVRNYSGPSDPDLASDIAVDKSGYVYVTGSSEGHLSHYDFATVKYGPNGDSLWVRRYNGPGNNYEAADEARAVVVNESGDVYVAGNSVGVGTAYDITVIKYSSNGDSLWIRRYDGPNSLNDIVYSLTIDNSGNVYVTGYCEVVTQGYDFITIKYNTNGDLLWARLYDDTGQDIALDLSVDGSENVYVTGYSYGFFTSFDYATIKYNSNGDTLWVRRYNGPGNGKDVATSIVVDGSGNVYVTGRSVGAGSPMQDYATVKYGPNGDSLWVRRYNEPFLSNDEAYALSLDSAGNVYVTGRSDQGTYFDYATVKYSPNGDILWATRYNGWNGNDNANSIAVDEKGSVYVTGTSFEYGADFDYTTIKYSPCSAVPGDVNGAGGITLTDIIHLINFYFDKDKPPCNGSDPGNCWEPNPVCRGDVDGTAGTAITDIIYLVNYYFDKDRPATSCIGTDPGNCWTPVANGACCLAVP